MVLSRGDVADLERSERLASMRHQETSQCYAISDYLSPGWQRRLRRAASAEAAEMMEAEKEDDDDEVHVDAIIGDTSSEGDAQASSLSCTRSDEEEDDDDPSNHSIIEGWRDQVCMWCYAVTDHYGERERYLGGIIVGPPPCLQRVLTPSSPPPLHHLMPPHRTDIDREVVVVAMSYLDLHLSRRVVDSRSFQLAAAACLSLSTKLHGGNGESRARRRLGIADVAHLGRGHFDARDVADAELGVLDSLSWRVHPPTPLSFARDLLGLLARVVEFDAGGAYADWGRDGARSRSMTTIEETAEYLIELSSCDYALSTRHRPSSVAIASIAYSVELAATTTKTARTRGSSTTSSPQIREFLLAVARAGFDISDGDVAACLGRLFDIHAPSHDDDGDGGEGGGGAARDAVVASPVCPSRLE